jgi:hypothetical protein
MKCNMGKWDRILRGGLGIAIMGAGVYFQSWWGLIGLIPFFTSMFAWCPMYVPFKISTAPKSDE